MEVLKEAEGRTDVDQAVLDEVHSQPPPSEVDVEQMTEPTAEQKQNFAPQGYYAPEKTDYAHLGQEGYAPPGPGLYPTQQSQGSYQPSDYPPPPQQPPRPTSSSNQTHPQAASANYEGTQGHGVYGGGAYQPPPSDHYPGTQGPTSQTPYFPPPPNH
jgi:hypothetical protein